ncbi:MAG: hypothetical protein MAG451_01637 [Anaerolineales bacterium]|nr:hypothetical protein [Anaerolineales bacterium]
MSQQTSSLANFNWRRELLVVSVAAMEVTWLAGWIRILLGVDETAGIVTVWLSTIVLYFVAMTTARMLIQRPTPRLDWIIGGLVFVSTLAFVNLNLYPQFSLFNPRWLATLIGNITGGFQTWPREITGVFIGFFIWFRGLRLPRQRVAGIRTTWRRVKVGLVMMVALAVAAIEFPIDAGGIILTYFAVSLSALALSRIEETARADMGAASPFGRKWLMTLAAALLVVGVMALIATNIVTVEMLRTVLRPLTLVAETVLSAVAILAGLLAQYVLFPIFMALFKRFFPEGLDMEFLQEFQQQQESLQEPEVGRGERVLPSAEFLNALRVVGLTLLVLIVLWFVIHSFRRWRRARETAGGVRETARPAGSLAGDMLGYVRDQWQRLREAADLRRLLQRRGAGSVRAIYANLLTLLAAAGHRRRAGQTPYEFEPTAEQVLPAHETEIGTITEAYVRARYGEWDIDDEELRRLRSAWRQVRAGGDELGSMGEETSSNPRE